MSETVTDICAEMRDTAEKQYDAFLNDPDDRPTRNEVSKAFLSLADRIEAAVNRMAVPTPEQWTEIARQGSENESLKRALKPILDHDTEQYGHGRCVPEIVRIVRNAQAIMKEAAK